MDKIRLCLLVVALVFVSACSQQTVNEQHKGYLSEQGWTIKGLRETEVYTLDLPDEMLRNYEASGILFLRARVGDEVTQSIYTLKEKDLEGKSLKAVVFEVDGDIIGGHGVLPSWDPGVFSLDDKELLLREGLIEK